MFHSCGSSSNLNFLIHAYNNTPTNHQSTFFNSFFERLAGNKELKKQIINGISIDNIRKSWGHDLENFKKIREKYLLYN